jgi:hypothetical protein
MFDEHDKQREDDLFGISLFGILIRKACLINRPVKLTCLFIINNDIYFV